MPTLNFTDQNNIIRSLSSWCIDLYGEINGANETEVLKMWRSGVLKFTNKDENDGNTAIPIKALDQYKKRLIMASDFQAIGNVLRDLKYKGICTINIKSYSHVYKTIERCVTSNHNHIDISGYDYQYLKHLPFTAIKNGMSYDICVNEHYLPVCGDNLASEGCLIYKYPNVPPIPGAHTTAVLRDVRHTIIGRANIKIKIKSGEKHVYYKLVSDRQLELFT